MLEFIIELLSSIFEGIAESCNNGKVILGFIIILITLAILWYILGGK